MNKEESYVPAILIKCEDIAFVLNAVDWNDISMLGSKHLTIDAAREFVSLSVLWAVIPEDTHVHFTYREETGLEDANSGE